MGKVEGLRLGFPFKMSKASLNCLCVCVCVRVGVSNVMLRHNLLLEVKNCQAHSTFIYSNKIELFEVIAFY